MMESTIMFSSHSFDHGSHHSAQSGTNLPLLRRKCQFPIDSMAPQPRRQIQYQMLINSHASLFDTMYNSFSGQT